MPSTTSCKHGKEKSMYASGPFRVNFDQFKWARDSFIRIILNSKWKSLIPIVAQDKDLESRPAFSFFHENSYRLEPKLHQRLRLFCGVPSEAVSFSPLPRLQSRTAFFWLSGSSLSSRWLSLFPDTFLLALQHRYSNKYVIAFSGPQSRGRACLTAEIGCSGSQINPWVRGRRSANAALYAFRLTGGCMRVLGCSVWLETDTFP